MQACGTHSTFDDYAAMASRKGLVSESEPAIERTGTGQKRLFVATRKFRSQRECRSPRMRLAGLRQHFHRQLRCSPRVPTRTEAKGKGEKVDRDSPRPVLATASQVWSRPTTRPMDSRHCR